MRNRRFIYSILLVLTICSLPFSCTDQINDEDIYTQKRPLLGEYMAQNPEYFSTFYNMLEKTDLLQMMYSYGEYTCFIPDNRALNEYFQNCEFGSIDNFPVDSLKKIVLYQIIENDTIGSDQFIEGRLRTQNMRGDFLQVRSDEVSGFTTVNNTANIRIKDIRTINGLIHLTDALLFPDTAFVSGKLDDPSFEGRYSIISEALKQTGVIDQLRATSDTTDFSYMKTVNGVSVKEEIKRLYRYTLLVESDSVYNAAGIYSFEDLAARYDDGVGHITSPENGLNKFVSYHCLDRLYDYSQFIKFSQQDGYEIIETMCENTLLEFRNTPEGVLLNHFTDINGNVINEGVRISQNVKYQNIMSANGMIHEIEGLLEYLTPEKMKIFFNKKMRFNVASFLPELMNGSYRGVKSRELPDMAKTDKQFFKNLIIKGEAGFVIPKYDYTDQWIRHQFDEILIGSGYSAWDQETSGAMWGSTRYDVTLITPPLPSGITYEIRFGYTSNQYRGMAQIYFDGKPAGIPLWMGPVNTEYYGINGLDEETARKVLYNNLYMPFPSHITNGNNQTASYTSVDRMRRIITTANFSETKKHELRFKTVESGQLSLNFLELIPVDLISEEGTN